MNYSDLQTSVTNWAARSDSLTVAEVPNFISFATDSFNHGIPERTIAPIRTREMLTTADVTPVDGEAALPDDFLQISGVTSLNSIRRPLSFVSTGYTDARYADRAGGLPNSFSIVGSSLFTYPVSSTDLELVYYKKIPHLSNDEPTNWLLDKLPALYLHASLYHLAIFTKDNELIQRSAAFIASMIDGLNITDMLSIYSRTSVRMQMVTP
ncbi:MAG: hypothetical protein AAAC47_00335 [Pararhizobium sp.]